MNRRVFLALALATSAAFASATSAATVRIRAEIPFDFTVAGKKLPKGEYTIESINSAGLLTIRSAKGSKAVTFSTVQEKYTSKPKTRLAFRRYGEQYFLSRVWDGSGEIILKLKKSKAEKKAARLAKGKDAKDDQEDEEVEVGEKN
jgi:hypothetical protein